MQALLTGPGRQEELCKPCTCQCETGITMQQVNVRQTSTKNLIAAISVHIYAMNEMRIAGLEQALHRMLDRNV